MIKDTDVCIVYGNSEIANHNYGFGKITKDKRTRKGNLFISFNRYIMYRIMMYVKAHMKVKGKKYIPAKYRWKINENMLAKAKQVIFCVPEAGSKPIWDQDDGIAKMIKKLYVEQYNQLVGVTIYTSDAAFHENRSLASVQRKINTLERASVMMHRDLTKLRRHQVKLMMTTEYHDDDDDDDDY